MTYIFVMLIGGYPLIFEVVGSKQYCDSIAVDIKREINLPHALHFCVKKNEIYK